MSDYNTHQVDNVRSAVHELQHPTQIGPYHIQKLIGEGGMGNVYQAEQRHPIQRTVAIKIIKLGMDTRQVIARFESERQALALMNHPNVARVLDAGAAESGKPYFVMEFVQGEPITNFADRHKLTVKQRLELFMQACDAVQHAHQKAIIHRDLKPSNILVAFQDSRPAVKVIDFGVSKALSQRLTELTLFTETGQLVGTPEYMAPEQAESNGLDVDTRCDVYSLGVILYELLTGALPFDAETLRSGGYPEIRRIIREVDPPRPSTKLSSMTGTDAQEIAQRRQLTLDLLEKQLKTELEWIPLKAMRKDRTQRYASATELTDDIQNYLAHRPLRAGPETSAYRLRKFLHRNKRGVVVSAALVLSLVVGILAASWQAIRATRAEQATRAALHKAENATESMRAVNDFLTMDMLWSADPAMTRGREMSVREALDNAARGAGSRLKDRPLSEVAVRAALAGTYERLGRRDLALPQAQIALQIVERNRLEQEPEALQAFHAMATILHYEGKFAEAERMYRRALLGRQQLFGDNHPATLWSMMELGSCLRQQNKREEAEPILRDTLQRCRSALGNDAWRTLQAMQHVGYLLRDQGKLGEAEAMFREAEQIARRALGADHPDTIHYLMAIGTTLRQRGRLAEAESIMRQVLADRRRIEGEDHPVLVNDMNGLTTLLIEQGKLEEAEVLARQAVERGRRSSGDDDSNTLSAVNNLALVLLNRGKLAEAEPLLRESLAGKQRTVGTENFSTLVVAGNLAMVLSRQQKFEEAEKLLRQVVQVHQRVLPADNTDRWTAVNNLGGILFEQKKFAEAEPLFTQSLEARRRILGDTHPDTLGTLSNLGRTIRAQGRHAEAEPIFAELYRSSGTAQLNPRQAALFMAHWGPCLVHLGKYVQAESPLLEAHRRLTETQQQRSENMRNVLTALVNLCDQTDRGDEAQKWRTELATATSRPSTQR